MKKFTHKKSLGQNFLTNQKVIEKIVENAKVTKDDIILEIGPGEGVLTEALAKKAEKVIAVELDDRLIPVLKNKFKNAENVEIIHDDILKLNIVEFINKHKDKAIYLGKSATLGTAVGLPTSYIINSAFVDSTHEGIHELMENDEDLSDYKKNPVNETE